MSYTKRREQIIKNGIINPNNTCPDCEGAGEVFLRNVTGFNVKNMEVFADEEFETCGKCEGYGVIEPEEEERES
jgi:DnaJ-class molecular chaperone